MSPYKNIYIVRSIPGSGKYTFFPTVMLIFWIFPKPFPSLSKFRQNPPNMHLIQESYSNLHCKSALWVLYILSENPSAVKCCVAEIVKTFSQKIHKKFAPP
jgi:hypothetical protein